MDAGEILYAKNREEWRGWLEANHRTKNEIWLLNYKKHTGKPSVPYTDAVEEAICFGWIDGKVKSLDEEKYIQRYTPRKSKSSWSEINIERAEKMISEKKMSDRGLETYREGMKLNNIVPSSKSFSLPPGLGEALAENPEALSNFNGFAPSSQLAFVYWVNTAKTPETRRKRIAKTVELSAQNKKFGEEK
ncbi:hypothetical protein EPN96_05220 [bacterium]|nr:MAG: hypothetical protein EPN96_05220 [bacterium]